VSLVLLESALFILEFSRLLILIRQVKVSKRAQVIEESENCIDSERKYSTYFWDRSEDYVELLEASWLRSRSNLFSR
jgi:hypothetical protein